MKHFGTGIERPTPKMTAGIFIGAFGSFFAANVLFFFAVRRIGPVRVGLHLNLQPVITLVFAWLLIGETITVMKVIGLVVILAGVWIAKIPARARSV